MTKTPQWLVPPQNRHVTPNRYHSSNRPDLLQPVECVVLHFTVAYSAIRTAKYLANQARGQDGLIIPAKASAHFVVDRDGTIYQLAPLSDRCWHAGSKAGSSRWRGQPVNPRSIGIELANLGPLFREGGSWVDWWGRKYAGKVHPNPHALNRDESDHTSALIRQWFATKGRPCPDDTAGAPFADLAWEVYPEPQLRSVEWLLETLAGIFPVLHEADEGPGEASRICAHSDVDPSRKLDTWPAFPLDEVRSAARR